MRLPLRCVCSGRAVAADDALTLAHHIAELEQRCAFFQSATGHDNGNTKHQIYYLVIFAVNVFRLRTMQMFATLSSVCLLLAFAYATLCSSVYRMNGYYDVSVLLWLPFPPCTANLCGDHKFE